MKFKKTISVLVSAAMLAALPTTAFAAGSDWGDTNVDGGSSVQNPIIRYQIPTNLDFAVNAFQIGDATKSQIYSPDYEIINKSDVAIQVGIKARISKKNGDAIADSDGILIKSNPDDVKFEGTDKSVYLEVVAPAPTGVQTTSDSTTAAATPAAGTTPIATEPTSYAVEKTTPGADGTPAVYTLDLTGFVGGNDTAGKFVLNFAGKDFAVTPTANMTATELVAAIVALSENTVEIDGKTFTASDGTAGKLVFTSGTAGAVDDSGVNLTTYSLIVGGGTEGKVALDKATWLNFGDENAVRAPLASSATAPEDPSMVFALEKANYVTQKASDPDGPKTLFDSIAKASASPNNVLGATQFRFMGKANPLAKWEVDDLHVKAVFSVRGLNEDMYTAAVTAATGESSDGIFTKGANVVAMGGSSSSSNTISLQTPGNVTAASSVTLAITGVKAGETLTKVVSVTEKGTANVVTGSHTCSNSQIVLALGFSGQNAVKGKTYVVVVSNADDSYQPTLEVTFNA